MVKMLMSLFVIVSLVAGMGNAFAITLGQLDDFEDGTTMSWIEGAPSPNPPTNIPSGGPTGANDNYLEVTSTGGGGPGSRLVVFNQAQWTGDFIAEGITRIDTQMANFGNTSLSMRIAVEGAFGNRFSSTSAVLLPTDGQWYSVSFGLSSSDLSLVSGTDTLDDVLANVTMLRILSNAIGPDWRGDRIAAELGVDNITAIPEPSTLILLGFGLAGLGMTRRRSRKI